MALQDHLEHGALKLRDGDRRQRAAVALADRSTDDGRPRFRSKIQEPERVGDRDAALPHALGDLLVGKSKAVDQLPIRRGLFDRIQVGSLDVLDQRQLKHALIRAVTNHGRNRRQAGLPRGPDAPLTRDQLIATIRAGPHDDRLNHAVLNDRRRELCKLLIVESSPRLMWIARDAIDRHLDDARLCFGARDERLQAAPEPVAASHAIPPRPRADGTQPPPGTPGRT